MFTEFVHVLVGQIFITAKLVYHIYCVFYDLNISHWIITCNYRFK